MQWNTNDHRFMARAIQLASRASYFVHPNPRVGCVLVRDNKVIAEGWHHRAGEDHAEIAAIKQAGETARESSCYVTLEPCSHTGKTPPCADTVIKAGIREVTVAMTDPNPEVSGQGIQALQQAGIVVRSGLMQLQSESLNPGFLKRMRQGLPYVRCKMAMSLDGRTALANGNSKWITSETARTDVHKIRARSSAILTGIDTVLADDPSLTVRMIDSEGYQPLRVIMDSQLRTRPEAALLAEPGSTLIFTISSDTDKKQMLIKAGAEVIDIGASNDHIDLKAALEFLATEKAINEVLVESGPTLAGSLVQCGLVDELILYTAPRLLGNDARGLFALPMIENMQDSLAVSINDIRMIGCDVRISVLFSNGS